MTRRGPGKAGGPKRTVSRPVFQVNYWLLGGVTTVIGWIGGTLSVTVFSPVPTAIVTGVAAGGWITAMLWYEKKVNVRLLAGKPARRTVNR